MNELDVRAFTKYITKIGANCKGFLVAVCVYAH